MQLVMASLFDRIYVVSLERSTDRRKYVDEHLGQIGIVNYSFFEATDQDAPEVANAYASGQVMTYPPCFRCGRDSCGQPGCNNMLIAPQVAVYLTYLRLWRAIASRPQRALVVEDDVLFHANARDTLSRLAQTIAAGDLVWTPQVPRLLRLGWAHGPEHEADAPFRILPEVRMSNPCHALTSAYAQALVDRHERIATTADIYLHERAPREGEAATVLPPIASELSWSTGAVASLIHPKPIRTQYLRARGDEAGAAENERRIAEHVQYAAPRGAEETTMNSGQDPQPGSGIATPKGIALVHCRPDRLGEVARSMAGISTLAYLDPRADADSPVSPWSFDDRPLGFPALVAYLDRADGDFLPDLVAAGVGDGADGLRLAFLVRPAEPPEHAMRPDGGVRSFVCSSSLLRSALERFDPEAATPTLAFLVAEAARCAPAAVAFDVMSRPGQAPDSRPRIGADVTVVIPHRGDLIRLQDCLRHCAAEYRSCRIAVGFDEALTDDHGALIEAHPGVDFIAFAQPPVGPYVVRGCLAEMAQTAFLLFQDSDDLPCRGRLTELSAAQLLSGADAVGSHELRVDEIAGAVFACRFPTDVNRALAPGPAHAQLHPTTLIRRRMLTASNGFSTRRRFASDTEFLLRSHFTNRIVNRDAFCYIRVRREGSLTTTPRIALGTPIREKLRRIWCRDFEKILAGTLSLDESGLRVRHAHRRVYEAVEVRTRRSVLFDPAARIGARIGSSNQ